jgi:hypothetical protein
MLRHISFNVDFQPRAARDVHCLALLWSLFAVLARSLQPYDILTLACPLLPTPSAGDSRCEQSSRAYFPTRAPTANVPGIMRTFSDQAHFAPTFGSRPENKACYRNWHITIATSLHGPESRTYENRAVAKDKQRRWKTVQYGAGQSSLE